MDFLGLRTLTVIQNATKLAERYSNKKIDLLHIDYNDPKVLGMIGASKTVGVFQLESAGMKNFMKELKPQSLEDIIAGISLYRPGPMDFIPQYIKGKNNPESVTYDTPLLKPILEPTYGCIVYQEQVMQIVQALAGYSLGRADLVRRAMSKKKASVMEKERQNFVYGNEAEGVPGCIKNGIDEKTANKIYDEMIDFAKYAFNKSHAAAYANISYKTAWLKCHYPREYMAALLSSVLDNQNKLASYITECKRLGIRVLPPNVNESNLHFTVSGNDIRYGLLAVKNLGRNFIDEIISERINNPYEDFFDFCKRLYGRNMNSRAIESLIKCGAFDGLGANRRQLLAISKTVLDDVEYESRRNAGGQMSFFDDAEVDAQSSKPKIPDLPEFPVSELLHMENEIAGMYLSGHPLDEYTAFSKAIHADKTGDIINNDSGMYFDGKKVSLVCIVAKLKTQLTKNNRIMAFVNAEDRYGMLEIVIFPNVYEKYSALLGAGGALLFRGTVNLKENEEPKIICDSIASARTNEDCKNNPVAIKNTEHFSQNYQMQAVKNNTQKLSALYLRIDDLNTDKYNRAKRVLDIFDGRTPVIFYLTDTKRKVKAPSSMWVDINPVMIKELKYQLGDENVVAK